MENIIKLITEKAGISEGQAKSALDTVVGYLKDKMPGGIGAQVESFLHGSGGGAGNIAGGLGDKLGGFMK